MLRSTNGLPQIWFLILAAFPFQEKEEGRRNIAVNTKEENKKGAFEIEKNSENSKKESATKLKQREE